MIRNCLYCGKEFVAKRNDHYCCSGQCACKISFAKAKGITDFTSLKLKSTTASAKCYYCGNIFKPSFYNEKFCSDTCRLNHWTPFLKTIFKEGLEWFFSLKTGASSNSAC